MNRERSLFTTIWLWFQTVISAIGCMIMLCDMVYLAKEGEIVLKFSLSATVLATVAFSFCGGVLLLKWKKLGYTMFAIATHIGCLIPLLMFITVGKDFGNEGFFIFNEGFCNFMAILTLPFNALVALIVRKINKAVLKIKKNGKSCWQQLS